MFSRCFWFECNYAYARVLHGPGLLSFLLLLIFFYLFFTTCFCLGRAMNGLPDGLTVYRDIGDFSHRLTRAADLASAIRVRSSLSAGVERRWAGLRRGRTMSVRDPRRPRRRVISIIARRRDRLVAKLDQLNTCFVRTSLAKWP